MKPLEAAIQIAVEAHRGQTDKAGAPYILHPLRVMTRFRTETEQIAAVLHDVVEDTPWTLDRLRERGFSDEVLTAVDCLTRRETEYYESYIERARSNPVARVVKLADLEDNMDIHRYPNLAERHMRRLEKYKRARTDLMTGLEACFVSGCALTPTPANLPPLRVVIHSAKGGKSMSELVVYIDQNGDVVLESYDLGPSMMKLFGDSDCETWVRVKAEQKPKLAKELAAEASPQANAPARTSALDPVERDRDLRILTRIKERFGTSNAFREWLKEREIPFDFTLYT